MTGHDVVELRRYQLHPGRRDDLIALFDREFLESQDELGACVLGQFRDLDAPDAFVWLRGFADLPTRKRALEGFYGGPVWGQFADRANETMVGFDDVRLLTPVDPAPGLPPCDGHRHPSGGEGPHALIAVDVQHFADPVTAAQLAFVAAEVEPQLSEDSRSEVALLRTLEAENNFPRLPIRPGHVLVRIARFDTADVYAAHRERLASSEEWRGAQRELGATRTEHFRLEPTSRSLLR